MKSEVRGTDSMASSSRARTEHLPLLPKPASLYGGTAEEARGGLRGVSRGGSSPRGGSPPRGRSGGGARKPPSAVYLQQMEALSAKMTV